MKKVVNSKSENILCIYYNFLNNSHGIIKKVQIQDIKFIFFYCKHFFDT